MLQNFFLCHDLEGKYARSVGQKQATLFSLSRKF